MSTVREREDDGVSERLSKRPRTTEELAADIMEDTPSISAEGKPDSVLPPSHALLAAPRHAGSTDGPELRIMETDVGISEYVGNDIPQIQGIIKQRFTDFLVYEVDLDSNVVHVKSLEMPDSSKKPKAAEGTDGSPLAPTTDTPTDDSSVSVENSEPVPIGVAESDVLLEPAVTEAVSAPAQSMDVDVPAAEATDADEPWPARFSAALSPYLSEEAVVKLKDMFLEGSEPPFVSDSGWSARGTVEGSESSAPPTEETVPEARGRGRGRGRGNRGARGGRGGRGGGRPEARPDHRKVLSDPIDDKATRTSLHKIVRELFGGKLESETDVSVLDDVSAPRIAIKWSRQANGRGGSARGGRGGGGRGGRGERPPRGTYPPFIHFTLQKTNRDTQDALGHLSRTLHVNVKDLSVAGTKDKRGVTVQRVSLWRGNKTVEDVWKLANGQNGRKSREDATTQRGDRGIRIADFNYRKARLELGMLKGNAFVITLRNVQVESMKTMDRAMNTIKNKGFINYYGMQRFGTASIPTHSIGLALLKAEWQKAVNMILCKRPGEHPDVEAARDAWLVEQNLNKALALLPRRVVAERCILESYQKQHGETRNAMGALSTIPRNLRLMYVHAYQSYLWNAIVSERIRMFGADRPVEGDLVYGSGAAASSNDAIEVEVEEQDDDNEAEPAAAEAPAASGKRGKKPWQAPVVKTLTAEDLENYTIFDVIMPLPGRDVDYPGGVLGERYKELIQADGLDPLNWARPQKEYSLGGSYRHIMHLPKNISWSVLRYTDPDVPLAQADEDQLLGFEPPAIVEDGKFMALQIRLQLGTAAYATMALREVTKTETSSHFQTTLTQASEDQKYKGGAADGETVIEQE